MIAASRWLSRRLAASAFARSAPAVTVQGVPAMADVAAMRFAPMAPVSTVAPWLSRKSSPRGPP